MSQYTAPLRSPLRLPSSEKQLPLAEAELLCSIASMNLASSLQQSLSKEASGVDEISEQPSQPSGFVLPAQLLSLGTHTQILS